MKFSCSVEINQPIDRVIELFDNPDNMEKWQDGFVSFEHLSGVQGQPGAVSRLKYKQKNREFELIETIITRNLPHEFSGSYVHTHMSNTMHNFFEDLGNDNTLWRADVEYTKFNGFLPKLMGKLMPGMFKKQTQKWLNQFRDFAEQS